MVGRAGVRNGARRLQRTHEAGEGAAPWLGWLKSLLGTQWCPLWCGVRHKTGAELPCVGGQEDSINCEYWVVISGVKLVLLKIWLIYLVVYS